MLDVVEPGAPAHRAGAERPEEQGAQVAAVDLGVERLAGRGALVEQDGPVEGEHPHVLTLGPGDAQELLEQAGGVERDLSAVALHVQGAALVAGGDVGLALEDGDGDVVALQDAGEGQAAGAGPDDEDVRSGAGGVGHDADCR